jgi:hypothetical protein
LRVLFLAPNAKGDILTTGNLQTIAQNVVENSRTKGFIV